MDVLALFGINPTSWVTSFVTAMFKDVLGAIGTAAGDVLRALLGFMNSTTEPVFSSGWWTGTGESVFVRVLAVAGSLMFIGFAMSVVSSVLSRDHTIMARAALHLPLAVIEMASLVTVTAALVSGSDEIANYIAGGGSKGLTAFVTTTLAVAVSTGGIVGILLASFIIVAALTVWAVLIVRTALVYVAVMAGPLIFAATIHPSTRHVHKRYIEGGIAIIGSKIVMAIAFATGSAMLGGLGSPMSFGQAIGALMQALAILLIATFSPFIFIKLLIGAEALAIAEGLEYRPLRAGMSAASGVYHAAGLKNMLGRMGGGAQGGGEDPGGGAGGSDGGGGGGSSPGGSPARRAGAGVARAVATSRRLAGRARTGASPAGESAASAASGTIEHGEENAPDRPADATAAAATSAAAPTSSHASTVGGGQRRSSGAGPTASEAAGSAPPSTSATTGAPSATSTPAPPRAASVAPNAEHGERTSSQSGVVSAATAESGADRSDPVPASPPVAVSRDAGAPVTASPSDAAGPAREGNAEQPAADPSPMRPAPARPAPPRSPVADTPSADAVGGGAPPVPGGGRTSRSRE